ncbi:ComEA family DNA-binding protein [Geminocystis sp. GBBB08]|uniref:ComEA family DNA-binding protein n=1 Tax=Geminocystis sp. GBBB08 TaxID=2604140 RepID=UPI0027E28061|nr:ComEA family DNA-binding protein [Geminocystis sp. GBBB08]MBL1210380.1 ComEA family DNA-binding protein [Geminocystis sp. GBBB08]
MNISRQTILKKIQTNPYYRFQSDIEINIAAELGIKIDANLASVDDWLRLPGISITQARSLVEITNSGIHFLCLEDLASALGVSVLKIQSWQPILYFGYYSADSFYFPAKVNPNNASLNQLITIPNLDVNIAQKIINDREKNGNYRHIADVQKRLNLTQDFAYHLMKYFQF